MKKQIIFAVLAFISLAVTFYMMFSPMQHRPGWDDVDQLVSIVPILLTTCIFSLLAIRKWDDNIYTLDFATHEEYTDVYQGPVCRDGKHFGDQSEMYDLYDDGASHSLYRCNKGVRDHVLSFQDNGDRIVAFSQAVLAGKIIKS